MTNLMKLVKIIDLYEDRVSENRKNKLSSFPITGSIPFGVHLLEDLIKEYITNPNFNWRESYVCAVKANSIYSSPVYNRPFEIDLNRCERYVEEEGSFSYVLAGTGSGYVRPNGEFVSTQGGHRTTEAYAVSLNPEVRLLVNVKFHDPNSTDEQIVELEAKDHHVDAAKRNPQNTEHKFRSAYRSNEDWAVKLYNYLKPFDISVAGTLEGAYFSLPSHSYMSTARRIAGEGTVSKYLKCFTENRCEKEIYGTVVVAGSLFLKGFSEYIAKVDEDNNGAITAQNCTDSFDWMMKWYFTEYGNALSHFDPDARNLTQSDLVQGGSLYKGNEPAIARFVFLYNDFTRIKRLKISGRQKTAIPFEGADDKGWNTFLSTAHPLMKPALGQLATTKFF